eukprot:TRINITY_DN2650_c0_g2_i1.p1 TRINITY_DN2650_c0_g2~~TRINITY_DN2650_c0_g2_i1.p1  ORF type:complete len:1064 (+),score=282.76 TRINITY_DN2650_c0_g2_i1:60-3251(+)
MSLQQNKPELYHVLESSSNYQDNTDEIVATKSERFVLEHGKELRQRFDHSDSNAVDQISKEIREYKQLMNQFQCRDYPQLGHDTPFNIEGGVNFFQFLCRGTPPAPNGSWREITSGGQKLRLLIPDTIVYGMRDAENGSYGVWLASSGSGVVYRRDIFSPQDVVAALGDPKTPDSKVVAVLKRKRFDPPHSTETTLLDTRELRSTTVVSSTASSDDVQVVQRFIKPRSHRAFICRCTWSPDKPAFAHMATNHRAMNDESERNISNRFLLNTENHSGCTIFKMSSSAVGELASITRQIAKHVERVTPGVRFETLVTDFTRDDQNRWWLLQIKTFKLKAKIPKPTSFRQKRDTSTYHKMSACGACKAAFKATELTHLLNLGQIKKMVHHLHQRGIKLAWMERTDLHLPTNPRLSKAASGVQVYRRSYVCKPCYELYMNEMKLIETEKTYLRAIGTKIEDTDDGFVFPGAPLGVRSASSIAEDLILHPLNFELTKNEIMTKPIPKDASRLFKMYKFFFVFHGVIGFEPFFDKYPITNRYALQTNIFGQSIILPLLVPQADLYTRNTFSFINKTFLKYILSSEEALYVFFASKTIVFHLLGPDCEILGKFYLDLGKAIGTPLSKHELTCMIVSDILPRCRFRVSFGFDEVKACDLRLVEVLKSDFKGIYIPAPSFYAPEPISTEWLNMIESKDEDELLLAEDWLPPSKTLNVDEILNTKVSFFTISIYVSELILNEGFSFESTDKLRFEVDYVNFIKYSDNIDYRITTEGDICSCEFKLFFNLSFEATQVNFFNFLAKSSIVSMDIFKNDILFGNVHIPLETLIQDRRTVENMYIFEDDMYKGKLKVSLLRKEGLASTVSPHELYETSDEDDGVKLAWSYFSKTMDLRPTSSLRPARMESPILELKRNVEAEERAKEEKKRSTQAIRTPHNLPLGQKKEVSISQEDIEVKSDFEQEDNEKSFYERVIDAVDDLIESDSEVNSETKSEVNVDRQAGKNPLSVSPNNSEDENKVNQSNKDSMEDFDDFDDFDGESPVVETSKQPKVSPLPLNDDINTKDEFADNFMLSP